MNNRYILEFTKTGYVKYISHLDLLRVFKRTFRIAGIDLRFSQGYNPHPKMGFAQPLSLGYSSCCELIEFETKNPENSGELQEKIAAHMPRGIEIKRVVSFDSDVKSLAGETVSCRYRIFIPTKRAEEELVSLMDGYLAQESIVTEKKMKKTKDFQPVEIRPMIRNASIYLESGNAVIDTLLDSGSQSNLSPELVIKSFLEFANSAVERSDIEIERTEIHFTDRIHF